MYKVSYNLTKNKNLSLADDSLDKGGNMMDIAR